MSRRNLATSARAKVDAAGKAVATFQVPTFETWTIDRMAVRIQGETLNPTCRVYLGSENGTYIEGTYLGQDDASDCNLTVPDGQNLVFVWEAATPTLFGVASIHGWVDGPDA